MDTLRLRAVIRREVLSLRRDMTRLRLLIVAPVLQLILFGYAATNDVRHVPVAICDLDMTQESRKLIAEIEASRYFVLEASVLDPRQLQPLLLSGQAQVGLVIPVDFASDLSRGDGAQIGLYVDGTDSNTAGIGTAYLVGLLRAHQLRWTMRQLQRMGAGDAATGGLQSEPRVWYNVDLRSVNYMVPAVFGMVLLVITINLASLAVVRQRETGTLEQLLVTPLRTSEFLVGTVVPLGVAAMVDSGLIVLVALNWFHVPFRGDFVLLFTMAAVFLVANMSLGLVISVLAKTQQEAQIVTFLFIMPSVLLSGFMFPIANMPPFVQALTYAIPFRYFLEIVRGLFLRGVGVAVLWPQMLALSGFALGLMLLAVRIMRKRL
ncbi:MAG: ABC transporter permease [Armatimonadetes bacterium]|nr:ABC transporter permease [Armatimonadota bacterium]